MISTLTAFFRPPTVGKTVEQRRVARHLHYILLLGIWIAPAIQIAVIFSASRPPIQSYILSLGMTTLMAALYVLLRRGWVWLAGYVLVGASLAVIYISIFTFAGLRSPYIAIALAVLVVTSIVLGSHATIIVGLINALLLSAVYLSERLAIWSPKPPGEATFDDFFGILLAFGLTTILLRLTISRMVNNAEEIRQQATSLQASNTELRQIRSSLEGRTQTLTALNQNLQNEIAERQRVEQNMQRREATLTALSQAAEQFLRAESLESAGATVLEGMGRALDAHQASVVQIFSANQNDLGLRLLATWHSPKVEIPGAISLTTNELILRQAEVMTTWETALIAGHVLHGNTADFSPEVQRLLRLFHVQSIVIAPIAVGGRWWGALGFVDCVRERYSAEAERDAVGAVASLYAAALERQQMDSSLRESQKLESIGLLAGGVAHDFNNLLTGIMSQSALALRKLTPEQPARSHVAKVLLAAERAADLTRQLLAYAGKGKFLVEMIDLSQFVRDNVSILETAIHKNAQLHLQLMPKLLLVEADRGQLQQIVMNLVINAAEAIPHDHGVVEVVTGQRQFDPQTVASFVVRPTPAADFVCLEVRDNGDGMSEATLSRIFDPFFTTKSTGRGLGLSAIQGILRAQGGGLQVTSQAWEGSQFCVWLKAVTALPTTSVTITPKLEDNLTEHNHQAGVVLVVDDDHSVRDAVTDTLQSVGFATLAAEDGLAGLALFHEHQAHIGAVLLDIQMPGLDGIQTLQKLRELNNTVSVILFSGYSEHDVLLRAQKLQPATFLQKPFALEELVAMVRKAIQEN